MTPTCCTYFSFLDLQFPWNRILVNYVVNVLFYYINTNEIPGELLRENMIPSHVKITCYVKRSPLLLLYNKLHLSQPKAIEVKWFGISLVFM